MRRLLDRIYQLSGSFAAFFLACIGLAVIYDLGGQYFGYLPQSADEIAGYCMGASAFLGLPYAMSTNQHLRVSLFVGVLSANLQTAVNIVALFIAICLSGFFAYYSVSHWLLSLQFDQLSLGLLPIPLWLPKSAMALGSCLFTISIMDHGIRALFSNPAAQQVTHD